MKILFSLSEILHQKFPHHNTLSQVFQELQEYLPLHFRLNLILNLIPFHNILFQVLLEYFLLLVLLIFLFHLSDHHIKQVLEQQEFQNEQIQFFLLMLQDLNLYLMDQIALVQIFLLLLYQNEVYQYLHHNLLYQQYYLFFLLNFLMYHKLQLNLFRQELILLLTVYQI